MNKFSERLRELRLENKLSQRDLSKATGFSQPANARWENNLQVTNINVAIIFANYFKVTTDFLLGLED